VLFHQINNDCNTLTPFKYLECQEALGMENHAISDGQISASSEWWADHAASQGRLNLLAGNGKRGAWSAETNDDNQWLQVDLSSPHLTVTRVATQGRNGFSPGQWVTEYKLQYSDNDDDYQDYREHAQTTDKVKLIQRYRGKIEILLC